MITEETKKFLDHTVRDWRFFSDDAPCGTCGAPLLTIQKRANPAEFFTYCQVCAKTSWGSTLPEEIWQNVDYMVHGWMGWDYRND